MLLPAIQPSQFFAKLLFPEVFEQGYTFGPADGNQKWVKLTYMQFNRAVVEALPDVWFNNYGLRSVVSAEAGVVIKIADRLHTASY